MQPARNFLLIIITMSLTACAEWNSIYHSTEAGDSTVFAVDAKQRFLFTKEDPTNGTITNVCAEPSPDVFSVLSSALEGNVSTPSGIEAAFKAAMSESGGTIGIRTQSIQLLRDAMYRACEAHLAGALKPDEFAELQRRYQRIMVTLVAIEQLTAAVQPAQMTLTTSASASHAANVNDLTEQLQTAKTAVTDNEQAVTEAQTTVDEAQNQVDEAFQTVVEQAKAADSDGSDGNGDDSGNKSEQVLVTDYCELNPKESVCEDYKTAKQELTKAKKSRRAAEANLEDAQSSREHIQELLEAAKDSVDLSASGQSQPVQRTSRSAMTEKNAEKVAETVERMVSNVYEVDSDQAITFIQNNCIGVNEEAQKASEEFRNAFQGLREKWDSLSKELKGEPQLKELVPETSPFLQQQLGEPDTLNNVQGLLEKLAESKAYTNNVEALAQKVEASAAKLDDAKMQQSVCRWIAQNITGREQAG